MDKRQVHLCSLCKEPFDSTRARLKHRLETHLLPKPSGRPIKRKQKKQLHEDHRLPPWRCKICGERFYSELNRDDHFLSHGPKPFKCPTCERHCAFAFEAQLRSHMKDTHPGEALFHCETCGLRFECCCKVHRHAACHSQRLQCPVPHCRVRIESRVEYNAHLDRHMGLLDHDSVLAISTLLKDVASLSPRVLAAINIVCSRDGSEAGSGAAGAGASQPADRVSPWRSQDVPTVDID